MVDKNASDLTLIGKVLIKKTMRNHFYLSGWQYPVMSKWKEIHTLLQFFAKVGYQKKISFDVDITLLEVT